MLLEILKALFNIFLIKVAWIAKFDEIELIIFYWLKYFVSWGDILFSKQLITFSVILMYAT